MADAVWPSGLSTCIPLIAPLQETPPALTIRSQMDVGPAKVRPRVTSNVRMFTVGVWMTQAQLVTFDAFFVSTLAGGALTFEWKNPRTGNVADFRIVGVPTYSKFMPRDNGRKSLVSFEMELMPGTEVEGDSEIPPASQAMWGGGRGHYGSDGEGSEDDAGDGSSLVSGDPWFVPRVASGVISSPVVVALFAGVGSGFDADAGDDGSSLQDGGMFGTDGSGGPTIEKHASGGAGNVGDGSLGQA